RAAHALPPRPRCGNFPAAGHRRPRRPCRPEHSRADSGLCPTAATQFAPGVDASGQGHVGGCRPHRRLLARRLARPRHPARVASDLSGPADLRHNRASPTSTRLRHRGRGRSMFVEQFALLVLEAAAMAGLILGLFRARSVLGLSPLYIVMGGFQYLEATLSLQVSLWPGFEVYPGSSVMFTANLFAVLRS